MIYIVVSLLTLAGHFYLYVVNGNRRRQISLDCEASLELLTEEERARESLKLIKVEHKLCQQMAHEAASELAKIEAKLEEKSEIYNTTKKEIEKELLMAETKLSKRIAKARLVYEELQSQNEGLVEECLEFPFCDIEDVRVVYDSIASSPGGASYDWETRPIDALSYLVSIGAIAPALSGRGWRSKKDTFYPIYRKYRKLKEIEAA